MSEEEIHHRRMRQVHPDDVAGPAPQRPGQGWQSAGARDGSPTAWRSGPHPSTEGQGVIGKLRNNFHGN